MPRAQSVQNQLPICSVRYETLARVLLVSDVQFVAAALKGLLAEPMPLAS